MFPPCRYANDNLEEENHELHEAVEEAVKHVNQANTTNALSTTIMTKQVQIKSQAEKPKSKKTGGDILDEDQGNPNFNP